MGVHIPTIVDPWAMAIHPIRESLLVVSRADSKVREYDAQNGSLVRVLVSPGAEGLNLAQGMALSPTGRLFLASNQASGQLDKFNGILEFDSTTGAFVSNLIDGGSSVSETCSNPICLRGPNAMMVAPNGILYVISAINDSVQDYTLAGTFLGAFTSAKLIGPSGFAMRPDGTPGAGNLLVASGYVNPTNDFDDSIVEFSGLTRALVATNGGVFASGLIRPGPLAWHTDGNLLIGERFGEYQPLFADRVWKRNGATGASLGTFTTAGDTHSHLITALLHTHVNFATDDVDFDGDTDLLDLASFQNCFPSSTAPQCLAPFDDNRTATIGRWDFLAFIGNFHGPRRPCTNASQCNDNDVCSVDQCVGGFCTFTSAPDGTVCADSLYCDGAETCRSGVCRGKSPCLDAAHCNEATDTCRQCLVSSECNDNNPCTDDSCTAGFTCQFTAHTRTCNDGNPCTTNDRCAAAACVGGPPPNCNDNNVCSTDSCDPILGCIHTDNLLPCDDGNACTQLDFCLQGTCRRGRDRNCNDSNVCTDDSCNINTGCVYVNNHDTCDDADLCTVADSCANGLCAGTPKDCSDTVACTVDRCVVGNCQNVPENSRCSNGDWCDGTETCHLTLGCQTAPPPCEDNIPCTVDNCDPDAQTCGHTPNHLACSNGAFCDGIEQCNLVNGCLPGTAPDCDDNVACTVDACDELADNCSQQPNDLVCEDNNVCTDDVCTAAGCQNSFNTDTCNDGLACTILDTCANGNCAGTPVVCPQGQQCDPADGQCKTCLVDTHCNDNNGCTDDTCNAGACVYTPNSLSCDDGLFCTLTDVCSGGTCQGGGERCPGQQCDETTDACVQCLTAVHCDDSNICTDNTCVSGVCQFPANTAPCGDGLHCNGAEVCGGGSCLPGTPPDCGDGLPCTADSCNEATDSCDHAPDDNACNDTLYCNGVESCDVTLGCVTGAPPNCDDSIPCTLDACVEATDSCSHTPQDGVCDDGLFCNGLETCLAGVGCQTGTAPDCSFLNTQCANGVCDEATDSCVAQPKPNNTACDDSLFCTFSESCLNGVCTNGTVRTCNEVDGPCLNGVCNETTDSCEAQPVPNGSPCDDGLFCTVSDSCQNGSCSVFVPRDCSSLDEQCKDGVCDETLNACVAQSLPDGQPCNDGNACNSGETCTNGLCAGGTPATCDPPPACRQAGACDPQSGACTYAPVQDGTSCSDGNACNGSETCSNGNCVGGTTVTCDPPPACRQAGVCDPQTGACAYAPVPDATSCSDGNACNGTETCSNGTCVGGTSVTCNSPPACHTATGATCDPQTGACAYAPVPDATSCSDGNACNGAETCSNGTCVGGTSVTCDSPPECRTATGATCDPQSGACTYAPVQDGTSCSDGNACNGSEICSNGTCVGGTPATCDPPPACRQAGVCDPQTGACAYAPVPDATSCSDGNACNGAETCSNGTCVGGTSVTCDSPPECRTATGATCDPQTGACTYAPVQNGTSCSDGNACNGAETCSNGNCVGGTTVTCDPPPACRQAGVCDPQTGTCAYAPAANGSACDDGLFCTAIDSCINGSCVGAGDSCPAQICDEATNTCVGCLTAADCPDDSEVCTDKACVLGACQQVNNTAVCDDSSPCTINDSCLNGVCDGDDACPGQFCNPSTGACVGCLAATDCPDDSNVCTDKACVLGACQQVNNTANCNDSLFCTAVDTCNSGFCVGAGDSCPEQICDEATNSCVGCLTPVDCLDDGNVCTDAICVAGVCGDANNTALCDDGSLCTVNDSCLNGACGGNDACPGQFCIPSTGACVGCLAATDCPDDTEVCTDKACVSGVCQQVNNTALCDDGSLCTVNDSCLNGACGGNDACPGQFCNPSTGACVGCLAATDCPDDTEACTDRACVSGICQQVNNTANCNDSLFCTAVDICNGGVCVGAGDPCQPTETCDEVNHCVPNP
jgi:hypothetical protein